MEMYEWLWIGCYCELRMMKLQPMLGEIRQVGVPIGNSVTSHVLSRFPLTRGVLRMPINGTRYRVCRLYQRQRQVEANLFCIRFRLYKQTIKLWRRESII